MTVGANGGISHKLAIWSPYSSSPSISVSPAMSSAFIRQGCVSACADVAVDAAPVERRSCLRATGGATSGGESMGLVSMEAIVTLDYEVEGKEEVSASRTAQGSLVWKA